MHCPRFRFGKCEKNLKTASNHCSIPRTLVQQILHDTEMDGVAAIPRRRGKNSGGGEEGIDYGGVEGEGGNGNGGERQIKDKWWLVMTMMALCGGTP